MSTQMQRLETSVRRMKIAFMLIILFSSGTVVLYLATDGFVNNPLFPTTTTQPTNTTIVVEQGVKVTGTATYKNTTPITSQTLYGLDSDNMVQYIATVTNGAFTSNRGPAEGGTFDFYVAITGCLIYVATLPIPSADSYDQEVYSIGAIEVYTTSATYSAQLIGATSNSYSSGGSAGTVNFTQSANVQQDYTLRVVNTQDYSALFRQYTDPRDDIPIDPVLWIEITTTTAHTSTPGVRSWSDSTKTYFLVPMSAIICPTTVSVTGIFDFSLTLPNAEEVVFAAWLVDGSSLDHLLTARTRVADPATSETVSATQIVNAYIISS